VEILTKRENGPQPKDCPRLGFEVSPILLVRAEKMIEMDGGVFCRQRTE